MCGVCDHVRGVEEEKQWPIVDCTCAYLTNVTEPCLPMLSCPLSAIAMFAGAPVRQ